MTALPATVLSLPPVQEKVFDRAPKIALDLASEISVLDIRNPMKGLTVSLNGQDLNASKEALVASRVAISNTGKIGIKSSDMSAADPLGFVVKGGELLQITQFTATTSHLRKYANPTRLGNRVLLSTDIIIDNGDSLQFDLLIKKKRNKNIEYFPLGKIANIKNISILDSRKNDLQRSFFEETFFGNIFVQFSRTFVYFILGLIFISGSIFTYESLKTFIEKRNTKKIDHIISLFLNNSSNRNKIADSVAAAIYKIRGIEYLEQSLSDIKKINISSSIGKISSSRIDIIGEIVHPNYESILTFLQKNPYRTDRWLSRLEEKLNLINRDRTEVQLAYVTSLESMIDIAKTLDPLSKLKKEKSKYFPFDPLEYKYIAAIADEAIIAKAQK